MQYDTIFIFSLLCSHCYASLQISLELLDKVQMITGKQSQSLRSYEACEIDSDTEENDPVVAAHENGKVAKRNTVTQYVPLYHIHCHVFCLF